MHSLTVVIRLAIVASLVAAGMIAVPARAMAAEPSVVFAGGSHSYTVPAGATSVLVEAWGAAGLSSTWNNHGRGGGVSAVIAVTPGAVLSLDVGRRGEGGAPGVGSWQAGYAGGGATRLTLAGELLLVAGGGGGAGLDDAPYTDDCGGMGGANSETGAGANSCSWLFSSGSGKGAIGATPGAGGEERLTGEADPGSSGGSAASGGEGGRGGDGYIGGGGGGDGYAGGGGGGGASRGGAGDVTDNVVSGAPGGGGGSSYAAPRIDSYFLGSGREGDGSVTITPIILPSSTTTIAASKNTIEARESVTYTASITPAQTGGTVAFVGGGASIAGCTARPVVSGQATCTTSYALIGQYTGISARYSGTTSLARSTSASIVETVTRAVTTVSVTAPSNTTEAGVPVVYTATVRPTPAGGGAIRLYRDGTLIPGCENMDPITGTVTCTTSFPNRGTAYIEAEFTGAESYAPMTSPVFITTIVGANTSTVLTAPVTGVWRGAVLTATVTPKPQSGTVTFADESLPIAQCFDVPVDPATGRASCVTQAYRFPDTRYLTASFSGGGDYAASDSPVTPLRIAADTSLVSNLATNGLGRETIYTATISPIPGNGTLSFTDNGAGMTGCVDAPIDLATGVATCSTTYEELGAHDIVVRVFDRDGVLIALSNLVRQSVARIPTSYSDPGDFTFTVPSGWANIRVEAWGASGGGTFFSRAGTGGGAVVVTSVHPGDELDVSVGVVAGGGRTDAGAGRGGEASFVLRNGQPLVVGAGGGGAGQSSDSPSACGGNGGANTVTGGGGSGCSSTGVQGGAGAVGNTPGIGGLAPALPSYAGSPGQSWAAGGVGGTAFGGGAYWAGGGGGNGYAGGGGGSGVSAAVTARSGGGGGGSSYIDPTALSGSYLGTGRTGNGGVTFSHAATDVELSAASTELATRSTRTLSATLVDDAGTPVSTGPDATKTVTFASVNSTGSVTGLRAVAAVDGVATIEVIGAALGDVRIIATSGTFESSPVTFTVGKRAQVISATGVPSSAALADAFTATFSSSAALSVDVAATGGCTATRSGVFTIVVMTSGSIDCVLTATQGGGATTEAATPRVVTVIATKRAQTITFDQPASPATLGSSFSIAPTVTASRVVTVQASGGCTIDDITVTMTSGVDACVLTATQNGDADYAPAIPVIRTVAAQGKLQVVTVPGAPTSARFGSSFAIAPVATSTLAVSTTASGGCSIAGTTVTMSSGTTACVLASTQAGDAEWRSVTTTTTVAATKATQTVQLTGIPTSMVYGTSATATATSSVGSAVNVQAIGGCSVSGLTVTKITGDTACTILGSAASTANYNQALASVNISPVKAAQGPLIISGVSDIEYGSSAEYSASGGSGSGALTWSSTGPGCTLATTVEGIGAGQPCLVTATKASDSNYLAVSASRAITITARQLMVNAEPVTVGYGATASLSASLGGFVLGDTAAVVTGAADCSRDPGTDVGDYLVSCLPGTLAAANYSFAAGATALYEIGQRALVVRASSASVVYGSASPSITPEYDGLVPGDAAPQTAPVCVVSAVTVVGDYATSCSGADDDNYSISYLAGTLTVAPAPLTITASSPSAIYGDAAPVVSPAYRGLVNGDSAVDVAPICSSNTTSMTRAGSFASTCSGANDDNYTAEYVDGVVTITPAPLDVTALDASTVYGDASPVIAAEYDGFRNGDDESDLTAPAVCSASTLPTTAAGLHVDVATCSGAASPDYSVSYTSGDVDISRAPLMVRAGDTSVVFGDGVTSVPAGYTGFVNGEGPADLGTAPMCVTTVTALSAVGVHAGVNTCSGAVAANYDLGYATGDATVTLAPLVVTASGSVSTYGDPIAAPVAQYSGFRNGETSADLDQAASCSTTATARTGAGRHAGAATCSGASDANYAVSFVAGDARIDSAPLTATVIDTTRVEGEPNGALVFTVSGLRNGDATSLLGTARFATKATVSSAPGRYPLRGYGLASPDYTITWVDGTVTVLAADAVAGADGEQPPTPGATAAPTPQPSSPDSPATTTGDTNSAPAEFPWLPIGGVVLLLGALATGATLVRRRLR